MFRRLPALHLEQGALPSLPAVRPVAQLSQFAEELYDHDVDPHELVNLAPRSADNRTAGYWAKHKLLRALCATVPGQEACFND